MIICIYIHTYVFTYMQKITRTHTNRYTETSTRLLGRQWQFPEIVTTCVYIYIYIHIYTYTCINLSPVHFNPVTFLA